MLCENAGVVSKEEMISVLILVLMEDALRGDEKMPNEFI